MSETPIRRRLVLSRGLSVLWLFDALLKLQPSMFTSQLIVNVIAPSAADNQPPWLHHLMIAGARSWYHWLPWSTFGILLVEGFLAWAAWRGPDDRLGRLGLNVSIIWAIVVWIMAEGLGGLLTSSPSLMTNAPGSAPLYAVIAGILLLPPAIWRSPRFYAKLRRGLSLFFLAAALIQTFPTFWTAPGAGGIFGDITMNGNEPVAMQQLINALVLMSMRAPILLNLIFISIMVYIAFALWQGTLTGPARLVIVLWLAFIWIAPQAMGGLLTGSGTDPGVEFPLALLLSLIWQSPTQLTESVKNAGTS